MKKTGLHWERSSLNSSISDLDLASLARVFRQRDLTPLEVCEHLLDRLGDDRINCNAFAHVDAQGALAAARESAARWREGRPLGPLDGIPVAVKDVLDVAGMPTRFGSAALADAGNAELDCLLARRLRAAGAILLGKTRTWEFAWRRPAVGEPSPVVSIACSSSTCARRSRT